MSPHPLNPNVYRVALADVLPGEANLRSDGTLWSHAATLGDYVHGGSLFTLDAETVAHLVTNFRSGYPAKVPIDYEHETQTDAIERPNAFTLKAGQIVEVAAVLTLEQLQPEMKAQLDVERARRQRIGLSREVDPLGLWVRWEPTQRALKMVKDREVTEMSVVIHFDYPHKNTGEGQGPTLLSVALTNTPFLDDMVPVAASRSGGRPDSPAATPPLETSHMNGTLLMSAVAALTGKPIVDESGAIAALNEASVSLRADAETGRKSRETLALLTAEIGVSEPAGAILKVRELRAKVDKAETDAKAARLAQVGSEVTAFLTKHEKRLSSVPLKKHFEDAITKELIADPALRLEDAPSAKVVLTMGESRNLDRKAPTDSGQNVNDAPDVMLAQRANELMESDAEVKAIFSRSGAKAAHRRAVIKAARELGITDIRAPRAVTD